MSHSILVIEDDKLVGDSLMEFLSQLGYEVVLARDAEEGLEKIGKRPFHIALIDLRLPRMTGLEALRSFREGFRGTDCVMMTSFATVETAVEAIKIGAVDYLTKPIQDDELKILLERVIDQQSLKLENEHLKEQLGIKEGVFHHLIGQDPKIRKIYSMIQAIGDSETTVLLKGESGTGKGMIAQAIHKNDTSRREGPYVEVSCGAIPRELLESELFGHVKGAFTSAFRDRMGRFEMAEGGTILLDEIDSLPPYLQVKLLRVLQHKVYEMVGDAQTKRANVRIIAATNRNLEEEIKQGNFREDLYYRLNVITIEIPPLRERKEDIPAFVTHFLRVFNEKIRRNIREITQEAMKVLMSYDWPGNVRELENSLERMVVLSRSERLGIEDLPDQLNPKNSSVKVAGGYSKAALKESLKEPEKMIIVQALEQVGGNRKKAAEMLHINRTTLYNKMKEHQLL